MEFRPYTKQQEFFAAGAVHRERLLMAANQVGKTVAGAAEVAFHTTGLYPDWWEGRRFDRPTNWWAASVTGDATRDNVQAKLVGPPAQVDAYGTGFIPRGRLLDWDKALGTPNLLDNIQVKHVGGGVSTIGFKAYSQERQKWQGPTLDGLWLDEEPPMGLYMEGLTRTNAVPDSVVFLTFTPLLGMSEVVRMFLGEDGLK
jgi:phage terminase large subunit-like protein